MFNLLGFVIFYSDICIILNTNNTTAMHYYFYNHNDDYISFDTLAEATKYAKENYPWVLKIRDNMGGEYFI
jgi:glutathione synthase/RimK-type ligase-like ATP-grasp enzyme